ncbi:MAG: ParB N-terminal domain-containing protein [Thalassovita sp.]
MNKKILWPADNIQQRDINLLSPFAKNSRKHSEEQIERIGASIEEWGWTVPVLVDANNTILAGHGRVLAAKRLGVLTVPVVVASGWSDEQKRAYVIADNRLSDLSEWDDEILVQEIEALSEAEFDLDLVGFTDDDLSSLMNDTLEGEISTSNNPVSLADEFGIAPFSVLNAREGWWQNRKRAWLSLGIKSELGRGENGFEAMPGGSAMVAGYTETGERKKHLIRAGSAKSYNTTDWVRKNNLTGLGQDVATGSGTSIFDPVLCELAYSWFCPAGGSILDPFAGGSVRGVVASQLGRPYTGIELRPEQVKANQTQATEILEGAFPKPDWIQGDSLEVGVHCNGKAFDFLFSCPPYGDLEVYSDNSADLSTMKYPEFVEVYREIIIRSAAHLKNDRFACFVVGDIRDNKGAYRNFVGDTVEAFRAAGLSYYNEGILVTQAGSLPIRAGKQFRSSRKLGKTHQNVLVFCKGNGKRAAASCGPVQFGSGNEETFKE